MTKTAAQRAYERDTERKPTYPDGSPRKTWEQLCSVAQWSWGRNIEEPKQ